MAGSDSVGFVGLGIMGSRQAANLARAGYELTVYNRTRERAEAWVAEHGGSVAGSPREVAERSDVVITMVVDGPQVERMILGEDGALAGARDGTLFVVMSTIAPATSRSLAQTLAEAGHAFVDAPVTGSSPKAEAGTLTIMCGGAEADVARARPLFEVMGEKIVHAGEAGQGQAVKVLSQGVTAVNCATLAQAITVARRSGIDLDARLVGLDDARAQGPPDGRARLPRPVQARAHAQGRASVPGGVPRRGRLVPLRGARRRALQRRGRARPRPGGLRGGAGGRRGAHWRWP